MNLEMNPPLSDGLSVFERGILEFIFFFQAEDGIRDRNVTGVQTCALPILILLLLAKIGEASRFGSPESILPDGLRVVGQLDKAAQHFDFLPPRLTARVFLNVRSEERRVGKECRSRWSSQY